MGTGPVEYWLESVNEILSDFKCDTAIFAGHVGCKHTLAVGKLIKDMISDKFGITIIDGEAGPEQVNRRVIQNIDTLLVVADTSNRSLQTARDIMKVAQGHGNVKVCPTGLIINKFKGNNGRVEKVTQQMGLEILGYIPEDENVSHYDSLGKPLFDLPADSPSLIAISQILRQFC